MLTSLTIANNRRQGTILEANIIYSYITKNTVAPLCLKNDLERSWVTANVQFSLDPLVTLGPNRILVSQHLHSCRKSYD